MSILPRLVLVLLIASAVGSVWLVDGKREAGPVGWYTGEVWGHPAALAIGPNGRYVFFTAWSEDQWLAAFEGTWIREGAVLVLDLDQDNPDPAPERARWVFAWDERNRRLTGWRRTPRSTLVPEVAGALLWIDDEDRWWTRVP